MGDDKRRAFIMQSQTALKQKLCLAFQRVFNETRSSKLYKIFSHTRMKELRELKNKLFAKLKQTIRCRLKLRKT